MASLYTYYLYQIIWGEKGSDKGERGAKGLAVLFSFWESYEPKTETGLIANERPHQSLHAQVHGRAHQNVHT